MNLANVNWQTLLFAAAAILLVAGGVLSWWLRRPRDPEEVERRRRAYLNQVGRIVEGHIVEITEAHHEAAGPEAPRTPHKEMFGRKSAAPAT